MTSTRSEGYRPETRWKSEATPGTQGTFQVYMFHWGFTSPSTFGLFRLFGPNRHVPLMIPLNVCLHVRSHLRSVHIETWFWRVWTPDAEPLFHVHGTFLTHPSMPAVSDSAYVVIVPNKSFFPFQMSLIYKDLFYIM